MQKALFDNSISYSPLLGRVFGVCGALLIQQIHYYATTGDNFRDGEYWVYNTATSWAEKFDLWDERTIRSTLKKLRAEGVVVCASYNKSGFDKTLWYRVGYEALIQALSKAIPNRKFTPSRSGKNFRIGVEKISAPIPKTTTKTTTKKNLNPPPLETPDKTQEGTLTSSAKVIPMPVKKNQPKAPAKVVTNTKAILEKLANPPAKAKESRAAEFYKTWAVTISQHHRDLPMVSPFTLAQKAMANQIYPALGGKPMDALAMVIKDWAKFVKFVKERAGIYKAPTVPNLQFLSKHKDLALGYFLSATRDAPSGADNCINEVPHPMVSTKATRALGTAKEPPKATTPSTGPGGEDEEVISLDYLLKTGPVA